MPLLEIDFVEVSDNHLMRPRVLEAYQSAGLDLDNNIVSMAYLYAVE